MISYHQRPAKEQAQLLTVAGNMYRMGHAADTVAGCLACHEDLPLNDAIGLAEKASRIWSKVLWESSRLGVPIPAPPPDVVAEVERMVTTRIPGADEDVRIVPPPAPEPAPPPAPPATCVEPAPVAKRARHKTRAA